MPLNFTPPLRVGHLLIGMPDEELRAKPASDSVGGIMRNGNIRVLPPTTSAFVQRTRPLSGFPLGKPDPLKGGVKFSTLLLWTFSTPLIRGV